MKRYMNIRSGIFILALVVIAGYLFATGEETWAIFLSCLMLLALIVLLILRAASGRKKDQG